MNKIQSFKSKFKKARSIAQIIKIYKELLKFTKTESPKCKDISTIVKIARNNNHHPKKEFKISDINDPKHYREWEKIQKFPSVKLLRIHRHCEYLDKENSNMANHAAYQHCKNNKLRIYVCKKTEKYTKHYNNAWSKAFNEYSKNDINKVTQQLINQENEIHSLELELKESQKINKLLKKYGNKFQYLLMYGTACMKRNGFNGKKTPNIDFAPSIIELAKTITFTPPKTAHNQKTIISKQ